jgi:hypothetical protein
MKIQPIRAKLLGGRTDGRMVEDKRDETNKSFSKFCERV